MVVYGICPICIEGISIYGYVLVVELYRKISKYDVVFLVIIVTVWDMGMFGDIISTNVCLT